MTYRLVVYSNRADGREDEYNDWYTNIHLPEVCAVPGVKSATRIKLTAPMGPWGSAFRYAAIYEVDAEDPTTVVKEIGRRVAGGEMRMSDSMNPVAEMALFEDVAHFPAKG